MDLNQPSSSSAAMKSVGLFYNNGMLEHQPPKGRFDEIPERLERTYTYLESKLIIDRCSSVAVEKIDNYHLSLVHKKSYIDGIQNWATDSKEKRKETMKSISEDVYMSPGTFDAALLAAGSVVQASHLVFDGGLTSAFAIVRPPGHHASHCQARGFCVFNNVAIASQSLLTDKGAQKVLIVDWDVHFGDGTQATFAKNSQVLYFSLHRYDFTVYYPHDTKADYTEVGEGDGRFYTVNVPFNNVTCGDAEYVAVWDSILIPLVREFKPEIILISGGFDAAVGDMGEYKVTPHGFSMLLRKLMKEQEKIVVALEGGYQESLPECVYECFKALLWDDIEENITSVEVHPVVIDMINKVRRVQSQHWTCFSDSQAMSPPVIVHDLMTSRKKPKASSVQVCRRSQHWSCFSGSRAISPLVPSHGPRRPRKKRQYSPSIGFPVGRVSPAKRLCSTKKKKKPVSHSVKAGLVFPVGRTRRKLKAGGFSRRLTVAAPVYLAAVLEELVSDVLTIAGNIARRNRKKRITPRHILFAIRNDVELDRLLRDVIIPSVGVIPH